MIEEDIAQLETLLVKAINEFDHPSVERICHDLNERIGRSTDPIPFSPAKSILNQLRRKRHFSLMLSVAEAMLSSGQKHPQIKRQYLQGLIDKGLLSAAESAASDALADPGISKGEMLELIGLTGRIFKQRFIGFGDSSNQNKADCLERSIVEYLKGHDLDNGSYWHSINAVALLKRAERDGISISGMPDANKLAENVMAILSSIEEESVEPPKPWELATLLEAKLALNDPDEARAAALAYCSHSSADAFEIGSTLRQLVEIWELDDETPPGSDILPLLRAALLEREGGGIRLSPEKATAETMNLESAFGDNAPKTIKWYKLGLERTAAIARIELPDGRGIGTAGIVDGSEFFSGYKGLLLLTNAHVVSENPADSGLAPNRVKANIQGIGEVFEIERIVWSSPQRELDASFLAVRGEPSVKPLPVSKAAVKMSEPAPRVYVIGHPSGRDLEISLDDSRVVASNDTFLHYRTPTEPGSSGSPVFDQFGWEVVALHHGGGENVPRIDNEPGTYQANEGISMEAIKKAILHESERGVGS